MLGHVQQEMSTETSATLSIPAPSRPQKMTLKQMTKFLLMNLPDGWEARFTEKGKPYFCNHSERYAALG